MAINVEEMPKHAHTGKTKTDGKHKHTKQSTAVADNDGNDGWGVYIGNRGEYNEASQGGGVISNIGSDHAHDFKTAEIGGSKSHENRPPFVALNFIIKY